MSQTQEIQKIEKGISKEEKEMQERFLKKYQHRYSILDLYYHAGAKFEYQLFTQRKYLIIVVDRNNVIHFFDNKFNEYHNANELIAINENLTLNTFVSYDYRATLPRLRRENISTDEAEGGIRLPFRDDLTIQDFKEIGVPVYQMITWNEAFAEAEKYAQENNFKEYETCEDTLKKPKVLLITYFDSEHEMQNEVFEFPLFEEI